MVDESICTPCDENTLNCENLTCKDTFYLAGTNCLQEPSEFNWVIGYFFNTETRKF